MWRMGGRYHRGNNNHFNAVPCHVFIIVIVDDQITITEHKHVLTLTAMEDVAACTAVKPVSTVTAEQGALTVLASGDAAGWELALPLIRAFSTKQFFLGPKEEARFMKLVINTLVGANAALLAEALSLGASGGLSRAMASRTRSASSAGQRPFAAEN